MDRRSDRRRPLSVLESPLPAHIDSALPQVYVACPLTGLNQANRRNIKADVALVKQAIERETQVDRLGPESWPVNIYAPIDHTAPWGEDGLPSTEVYRLNLSQVHDSDALIVTAENGGSAGVGQELEWAIRLGIPVAFLTAGGEVSRQIAGAPAFISVQSYNRDPGTLAVQVANFLRRWKSAIIDGPRRRSSRQLRYAPITLRLRGAWQNCPNPTNVAAQVRANLEYLELALSDARYVASMPTETLIEFAYHLGVSLHGLDPTPSFILPVPLLRALMAAAAEETWSDELIARLLYEGRDALGRDAGIDLRTVSGWRQLHQELE